MSPTLELSPEAAVTAARSHPFSPIAELAIQADALYALGRRQPAVLLIGEALDRLRRGESGGDVPWEIFRKWQARDEKTLLLRMAISLSSWSSFFAREPYRQLFAEWLEFEPNNAEPFLRYGLLAALEAKSTRAVLSSAGERALRHAHHLVANDRTTAALTLVTQNPTELAVPYDGEKLFVYPDLCVISTYVLLEQGDWFEPDIDLFRSLVREGDKVLDLGANVGTYSCSAARRTGPNGLVVSVEPAEVTHDLLARSGRAVRHWSAVHCAISDQCGRGSLVPNQALELNKLANEDQGGEAVDLLTVDHVAEQAGVDAFDIIKMDVEGHELQALAGAKKIMGDGAPIVFFEVKEGSCVHLELVDAFTDLGYDCYCYVPGSGMLVAYKKGMALDAYVLNMIAVKPQSLPRFEGLAGIVRTTEIASVIPL